MNSASTLHTATLEKATRNLPSISATRLVAGMQDATRTVMRQGAVVITRHEQPTMVLMSMEHYAQLKQAAEPDLDALTQQFEDMFAQMQGDRSVQAMTEAFDMTPQELGAAAVQAARQEPSAR